MPDVATNLAAWSSTSGSNAPLGGTAVSTGLDDNVRELQGVVVRGLSHKGADIASAGTTDLGAIEGLMHDITGTTTITSFGTIRAGIWKILKFEGALLLTHNATSLILPGGGNITTADGDTAIVMSEGSGNWRCLSYQTASAQPLQTLPAGTVTDYAGATAPTGWLECAGAAVSRTTYANLFTAIGETWGAGDASTTFNLPDFRNKARIGKGTGTVVESGTAADTGSDTLTVAANNTKWITGMGVVFTLASGTITGLTSGNSYFIIRSSSTAVKLASSLALAQAGTAVNMTGTSSPEWTITHTYTARTLGETGGEQSHAMSSSELLAHTHTAQSQTGAAFGQPSGGVPNSAAETGSAGGNAAMNIMSPFAVTMAIIKT